MALPLFQLGIRLDKIYLLRRILVNRSAKEEGMYLGQIPVVEYILEHPGCTQQEIAHWLQVSPASVALSTRRLQKRGLITKTEDPLDLRCKRLTATEQAVRNRDGFRRQMDACDERMFSDFTEEERLQLLSYLDRMLRNTAPEQYRDLSPEVMHLIRTDLKQLMQEEKGEEDTLC